MIETHGVYGCDGKRANGSGRANGRKGEREKGRKGEREKGSGRSPLGLKNSGGRETCEGPDSFLIVVLLCNFSSVPALFERYSVSSCSMSLSVVRSVLPFRSELMCVVPWGLQICLVSFFGLLIAISSVILQVSFISLICPMW